MMKTVDKQARTQRIKRQAYCAVEDVRRARGASRVLGIALIVLVVSNALVVLIEPQIKLSTVALVLYAFFSLFSSICFAVEYAVRLWVADFVYPDRTPSRARLRYVLSPMGIIDLLAFLAGLLVFVVPLTSLAFNGVRILRLVRLFKLTRYMRGLKSIERVFRKRRGEIVAAFTVLGLLALTASVLMYEAEHPVQPDKFDSVLTGMYWAMTTITTTGYGDLVPVTAAGRLIGFATMVLSIGVVAIPAGIFSAGFVAEFRAQDAAARAAGGEEEEGGEGEEKPGQEDWELD